MTHTYIHKYLTSPRYSLQGRVLAFTGGIQSNEYVYRACAVTYGMSITRSSAVALCMYLP